MASSKGAVTLTRIQTKTELRNKNPPVGTRDYTLRNDNVSSSEDSVWDIKDSRIDHSVSHPRVFFFVQPDIDVDGVLSRRSFFSVWRKPELS